MTNIVALVKNLLIYFLAGFGYRQLIFNRSKRASRKAGKPLLNAGCGYAYTELSDVNLDIITREVPNFVCGDIQDLSVFKNKQFGAVYASHVLEHVEDPDAALLELNRVAENVFIITPIPLGPGAWLHPDHKWVFWGTKKIARIPRFLRHDANAASDSRKSGRLNKFPYIPGKY